jgi:AbrB family looped-hinge helix DNA binding protein
MQRITISSKNQVVIPSSVRLKLKVKSGDRLLVERVTATEVVLRKEPTYTDLLGVLPAQTQDATQRVRKLRDTWQ